MPTEPRHLVLTGPSPENTHWLCAAVRAHFAAGGYRDAWAVTANPEPFLTVGLVVTTNPDIAAGAGAAHWVSKDLTGVLLAVGNEITARADTTPGAEQAGEPSRVLLALDTPELTDRDTELLLAILQAGPTVGVTVTIAVGSGDMLPGPVMYYVSDHVEVVDLPRPGVVWTTDERGGIRLGDLSLDATTVAGLAETLAATLAAPAPAGHSLVLGPTDAATVVLRMRAELYPQHTLRWLHTPNGVPWPRGWTCAWRSTVPEDLCAMWSGARQAVNDIGEVDLVVIAADPFTALDPDRASALDDLLATLDNGQDHGVRVMLSAPNRDSVPDGVLTWFDQNPERGTVIMVEDHGTR